MLEDLVAVELVHQVQSELEDPAGVVQALDQPVDLLGRRVDAEAGAGRRGDAEAVHQRLRAVVAGADGDAVAVEDLGDVVGVDALELERDRADALGAAGRAEDAQAGDLGQALERVVGDLALVRERPRPCRARRASAAPPPSRSPARSPGVPASKRAGGSA